MSEIGLMRARIKKVYPGPKWAKRVDKMSDNQVLAIFESMKKKGQINGY